MQQEVADAKSINDPTNSTHARHNTIDVTTI